MSSKAQDKDDGIVDSLQRFVTNRPLATFALLGSLAAGGASALAFHYFLEKKRQQRRYLLKKAGYEKFYDSMRKSMNNFGGLFAFELDDQAFRGVLW